MKYLKKRDDCNWAKRPVDIDHDQEVVQEYRILTATMALRLDWAEKQHPEIFGSEPSNWKAATAQAAKASAQAAEASAQEEEEEPEQVAK